MIIKDMQDMARTMVLHYKARWSDVGLSLWPYAMRMALHIMNHWHKRLKMLRQRNVMQGHELMYT